MKKNYLIGNSCAFLLMIFGCFPVLANIDGAQQPPPFAPLENAYHIVPLSGYNHDVIAEGTGGETDDKTSTTIDFSNDYFSEDFVPLTTYSGVGSAEDYGGGLPAGGSLASSLTPAVTYQFAPYDENNVLLLRPLTSNTGALNFQTTFKGSSLYILWVGTESQANNVGVTVYFGDGTSQVHNNQIAYDWVGGTTAIAVNGLSRVGRGTTQWAALNEFSQSGACKLFEKKIDIQGANQEKEITGVGFSYSGAGNYQSLAVFAISVFGEPFTLQADDFLTTNVGLYPNPASSVVRLTASEAIRNAQVFDASGRKVMEGQSDTVDVSTLTSGLYLVQITLESGRTTTRKFVKN